MATTVLAPIGFLPRAYPGQRLSLASTLWVACLPNHLSTQLTFKLIAAQPRVNPASQRTAASAINQLNNEAVPQAPFLRRPIWFDRNSLVLNSRATDSLHRDASWLKAHAESRILIVGSCDKSGSESCTHTLAEARGVTVRKFLEDLGVNPDQIVGVKGWDSPDHDCLAGDLKCQQLSRSVQLLLAPSMSK